ncbi:hypothetical protein [Aquimarina sp. RZ0]|uniref:hypothetical protein n=1 Tax=Aquimarina sp. RZ0 TaxID=2607730 RepID=UPI0011F352DD|nr:hypothetical protein [Aquimarina sp. RZ0]KAA1243038.1 hypothetical protein F0000_22770 [Aquimarina sp. RZ0]
MIKLKYKEKPKKITRYFSNILNDYIDLIESADGKKILKSPGIDYIYGLNRRIFIKAMRNISIKKTSNILLVGLGDSSIISILRDTFNYKGTVNVLELDQTLIDIAVQDFDLQKDPNINIIRGDAADLLPTLSLKNELSIINLFVEPFLNKKCFTIAFWECIINTLSPKGTVLFNTNSVYSNNINHIIGYMNRKGFSSVQYQIKGYQDIYIWKSNF